MKATKDWKDMDSAELPAYREALRREMALRKERIEERRDPEQDDSGENGSEKEDRERIRRCREEWSAALAGYREAGGTYEPTEEERSAEEFNRRLPELRSVLYDSLRGTLLLFPKEVEFSRGLTQKLAQVAPKLAWGRNAPPFFQRNLP